MDLDQKAIQRRRGGVRRLDHVSDVEQSRRHSDLVVLGHCVPPDRSHQPPQDTVSQKGADLPGPPGHLVASAPSYLRGISHPANSTI